MIGVYCIECSNGAIYYGSSINVNKRFYAHKNALRKNIHPNTKLQNLWNKHGENNFSFYMVEITTFNNIREKEDAWLKFLFSTENKETIINFSKGVQSPMVGRKHSEESKRKQSELAKQRMLDPNVREHLSIMNTGKKRDMTNVISRKGIPMTEIARANITAGIRKHKRTMCDETKKRISDSVKRYYAEKRIK